MIREMEKSDWGRVSEIYSQGLENGISTFETVCPTYGEWDEKHLHHCRFVAVEQGKVVGWVALSPTSARPAYRGSVEVSIYVDETYQRKGIGYKLMQHIINIAPDYGIWSLYVSIFSINNASIEFHKRCGFREIGYRERIARDRLGEWQNTTLMELRLGNEYH